MGWQGTRGHKSCSSGEDAGVTPTETSQRRGARAFQDHRRTTGGREHHDITPWCRRATAEPWREQKNSARDSRVSRRKREATSRWRKIKSTRCRRGNVARRAQRAQRRRRAWPEATASSSRSREREMESVARGNCRCGSAGATDRAGRFDLTGAGLTSGPQMSAVSI